MAQRSITSFFSAKAKPQAEDQKTIHSHLSPKKERCEATVASTPTASPHPTAPNGKRSSSVATSPVSPVSRVPAKRRRAVIESDSDEGDSRVESTAVTPDATDAVKVTAISQGHSDNDVSTATTTAASPSSKQSAKSAKPARKGDKPSGKGKTRRASRSPAAARNNVPAAARHNNDAPSVNRDDCGDSAPEKLKLSPTDEADSSRTSKPSDKGGDDGLFGASRSKTGTGSDRGTSPTAAVDPASSTAAAASASAGNTASERAENAYDPSRAGYHPETDAAWQAGKSVPYLALARTFELIETISGRLKTIEALSNYLRSVIALSPDDLLPSLYLCLNQLAPAYHGVELGVGETVIVKALAQATGRSSDKIRADVSQLGDLGLVAEASKSQQRVMFRPAALTVQGVYRTLKEIALLSGHSVMNKKIAKMQSLLVACRHSETRFIVRSLAGKLRIGLAEQSVLQALGQACAMTPPGQALPLTKPNQLAGCSAEKCKASVEHAALHIKTAYCECPSYDEIVPALLKHGVDQLSQHCRIRPGVPLKPMLAHPTKGVSEVLSRFEGADFTCEYKYDGERAQIHLLDDGSVRVYSRNQEDNTSKYPDIVNRFRRCLTESVRSCIIDSEAVAWDTEKQQIMPFQVLSTRKRKDAEKSAIKIQVQVYAFDLLYLNGESLVAQPFQKRRAQLFSSFQVVDGEFTFAKSMDSTNVEDIAEFLDESVKGNCEGLMVKTLQRDATYEIAKRSRNWLKLKKDYLDGVGDTIDVVVMGGFLGKGKRAGVYGGFLLGCYDPDNEEFQSICKIGTGFSDEDLQKHAAFFKPLVISSAKSYYRYAIEPDHWFDAVQVWEIKCADLSVSPVHKAAVGLVDPEKGISLRFPRFLRIRDDKSAEQATSAQQIADMYNNQDQVKNKGSTGNKLDEEDFY